MSLTLEKSWVIHTHKYVHRHDHFLNPKAKAAGVWKQSKVFGTQS